MQTIMQIIPPNEACGRVIERVEEEFFINTFAGTNTCP